MRHAVAAFALLALPLAACATPAAGAVSPSSPTAEQTFLSDLHQHGITTGDATSDLRLGNKVCFHWTNTTDSWDDVYPMFKSMTHDQPFSELDEDDTALFMVVATTDLCPAEIGNIPR